MTSAASMDGIASYATVFGPCKNSLAAPPNSDPNGAPVDTGLVAAAQSRGLVVSRYKMIAIGQGANQPFPSAPNTPDPPVPTATPP